MDSKKLLEALKVVELVLRRHRFHGTDDNPFGVRDVVGAAIKEAEPPPPSFDHIKLPTTDSTKTKLIEDLKAKPFSANRDRIIARALTGYYHDFETQIATPKMALDRHLREAGFSDLADKVRGGEYD